MYKTYFADFDFTDFWDDDAYALENYIEDAPSDGLIASIEAELGYKLPASYIELMKLHNGGMPFKTCFPTAQSNSWAEDHVQISGIKGIGREKIYSLCGTLGSTFFTGEGGYPDTGICICDTPTGGHSMIMLDYSKCGRNGEPEVLYVDGGLEQTTTFLAKDFETFIKGLVSEDVYNTDEKDLANTLAKLKTGSFSAALQEHFEGEAVNFDTVLRNLFTAITLSKGYFALHADPLSQLAYDIQFYLISVSENIRSKDEFIEAYIPLVALSDGDISAGGYADFFKDWFDERIKNKDITRGFFSSMKFSEEYKNLMFEKIKEHQ